MARLVRIVFLSYRANEIPLAGQVLASGIVTPRGESTRDDIRGPLVFPSTTNPSVLRLQL